MEVSVDGMMIDESDLEGSATLEDALQHVQANLCDENQLVVGVHCDGEDVPASGMADTLRQPAASFDRIDVFTGTRAGLVTDAMDQADACLADTEEACSRVAELLTQGETVAAAETLGDCLRVWQQIHEAVAKSIDMLQIDPDALRLDDTPLTELIGRPKRVLLQVRDALQAQDFVMLADILEYEFSEVTRTWHSIAALLRDYATE